MKHGTSTLHQFQVQNCYRIKSKAQLDTRSPVTIQRDLQARQVQSIGYLGNTVEEAAVSAAYKIAEAENKSFVAAEAVKEAERVAKMAEDMESFLQFATHCFDQSINPRTLFYLPIYLVFCISTVITFSLDVGRCTR